MSQPRPEERQLWLVVNEDRWALFGVLPSHSGRMKLARALTVTTFAAGALYVGHLCILYFVQDALMSRVNQVTAP